MGSDGFWEKVPMPVIGAICSRHYQEKNALAAADELVKKAVHKWKATSTVYMDDITCVVGYFNSEKIFQKGEETPS